MWSGREPDARHGLHFIGFRGDEYHSAVRIFGRPDFIHRDWDARAKHEIMPGDIAIFATGTEQDELTPFNFNDSAVL